MSKKIKYKKIKPGVFEKISEEENVVGIIKLDDVKHDRDIYKKKYDERKALIKILEELKDK